MEAKVGDRIAVESERVGQAAREGVVLEVLSPGDAAHYRVRWADGHETWLLVSELRDLCRCARCAGEPDYPISGQ